MSNKFKFDDEKLEKVSGGYDPKNLTPISKDYLEKIEKAYEAWFVLNSDVDIQTRINKIHDIAQEIFNTYDNEHQAELDMFMYFLDEYYENALRELAHATPDDIMLYNFEHS